MKRFLLFMFSFFVICPQTWADSLKVYVDTCDVYWSRNDVDTYSNVRNNATAENAYYITIVRVGQWQEPGPEYYVRRYGGSFDASALPDGAILDSALYNMYARNQQGSGTDEYCLCKATFSCNLTTDEWDEWDGMDDYIAKISQGSANSYWRWKVNTDSLDFISRTGPTYFGLRSENDVSEITPSTDDEAWEFATADFLDTANDPYWVIYYSLEPKLLIYSPTADVATASRDTAPDSIDAWNPSHDSICVHLDVLYFADKWPDANGWKYWMGYTPYPDEIEDPNIVISQDGEGWEQVPNIDNPIDSALDGYNSDVDIFMDTTGDSLWCVWRQVVEDNHTRVMLRASANGSTWTATDTVIDLDDSVHVHLSPTYVHDGSNYRMYYISGSSLTNRLWYRSASHPTGTYGAAVQCTVRVNGNIDTWSSRELWHVALTEVGGELFGLFVSCASNYPGTLSRIHFARSVDWINFSMESNYLLALGDTDTWDDDAHYRGNLVWFADSAKFKMWYPGFDGSKWRIGHTDVHYTNNPVVKIIEDANIVEIFSR